MRCVYETRVIKVVEKTQKINYRRIAGNDKDWTYDEVSLGWFVLFEGSHEMIHFGNDKPADVAVGDVFTVTMEKVT